MDFQVCLGCHKKYHKQIFLSHSNRGWEFQDQETARFGILWESTSSFKADFSQWSCIRRLSPAFLYKGTNSIFKGSTLMTSPKHHHLRPSPWMLRFLDMNFEEIHSLYHNYSHGLCWMYLHSLLIFRSPGQMEVIWIKDKTTRTLIIETMLGLGASRCFS